jgi:phosphotriesterase-related protein
MNVPAAQLNRRSFLQAAAAGVAACAVEPLAADEAATAGQIMTVAGPISPDKLGVALPHEHVLVDFIGADKVSRDRYDRDEVASIVLPHLRQFRELGGEALVECTPAYVGRDPPLLRRLARASGVTLLTNTGLYAAAGGRFLPPRVKAAEAGELAAAWVAEWREGIEGTGIRPGFIKIGVDGGALNEAAKKLIVAAGRTHKETGLTIAAHSGDGAAAFEQLQALRSEGVSPSAWIWVHAQSEQNADRHVVAAKLGAWVEFDGVGPTTIERHVELVLNLARRDLLDRVLISQDAGWYAVGEPKGGTFRTWNTLFREFLPALKKAGLTDADLHLLTVANPARAFTIGKRLA